MSITTLFFQNKLDPDLSNNLQYSLPKFIGETKIITIPEILPQNEFSKLLAKMHFCIAPRALEGVGLVINELLYGYFDFRAK